MRILSIDPGSEKSACLCYCLNPPFIDWSRTGIFDNQNLRAYLRGEWADLETDTVCVIESIRSFMMRVGNDVFDTVRWEGIFAEAFDWRCGKDSVILLPRKTVVTHLCGLARANDADVRAALIDKFPATGKDGKGNPSVVGTKKYPGPLYEIKLKGGKDLWSALALAVTYADSLKGGD